MPRMFVTMPLCVVTLARLASLITALLVAGGATLGVAPAMACGQAVHHEALLEASEFARSSPSPSSPHHATTIAREAAPDGSMPERFALARVQCGSLASLASPDRSASEAGLGPAVRRQSQLLAIYDTVAAAPTRSDTSLAPGPVLAGTSASIDTVRPRVVAATRATPASRTKAAGGAAVMTARVQSLAQPITEAARRHRLDPLLLHAVAHVESRHDTRARSPAGALGVMQVMPDTARRFGVVDPARSLHHQDLNLDVGAAYLANLSRRFGNDLPLVLAAYNAGEGAVERYGNRVPPFRETRNYVRQVLDTYEHLRNATLGARAVHRP